MILTSKLIWIGDLLKQEYMLGEFVCNKDLQKPLSYFQAAVALLPIALVDKKNTFPYPEAITTA
jgi:hypothetical protein